MYQSIFLSLIHTCRFLPNLSEFCFQCQISYFEFLIISELKFPSIEPRLPLWSANMLNSYMALDALHGERNEYGRLPVWPCSS